MFHSHSMRITARHLMREFPPHQSHQPPSAFWSLAVTDCPCTEDLCIACCHHPPFPRVPATHCPHHLFVSSGGATEPYPVCARPPLSITTRHHFLVLSARSSLALCLLPATRFAVSAPACLRFPPAPLRLVGAPHPPSPHRVRLYLPSASPHPPARHSSPVCHSPKVDATSLSTERLSPDGNLAIAISLQLHVSFLASLLFARGPVWVQYTLSTA